MSLVPVSVNPRSFFSPVILSVVRLVAILVDTFTSLQKISVNYRSTDNSIIIFINLILTKYH